jgi:hypothetical protein
LSTECRPKSQYLTERTAETDGMFEHVADENTRTKQEVKGGWRKVAL